MKHIHLNGLELYLLNHLSSSSFFFLLKDVVGGGACACVLAGM